MAKASSGGKSSSDLTKEEIEGTTNLFTSLPTRTSIRLSIDRLSVCLSVGRWFKIMDCAEHCLSLCIYPSGLSWVDPEGE